MRRHFILAVIICFCTAVQVNADWQATLVSNFDYVDTFDNLADWKPATASYINIQATPAHFSAFTDRTDSGIVWQFYMANNLPTGSYNAIADHGVGTRWISGAANDASTHKSLCIDYNSRPQGAADTDVHGVQRIAFQTNWGGQAPDVGYSSQVYMFCMIQFPENFFVATAADNFQYATYLKVFDTMTGFNTVASWGTAEEHAYQNAAPCNYADDSSIIREYGLNASVNDIGMNNFKIGWFGSYLNADSDNCGYYANSIPVYLDDEGGNGWGTAIYNLEWFGLEIRYLLSNPHGEANGEIEVWAYNQTGTQVYHKLLSGVTTFKDGASAFDHAINRFQLGGNRSDLTELDEWGTVDYFYVDDVIINDTRIGPTYFGLLSGGGKSISASLTPGGPVSCTITGTGPGITLGN